MVDMAWTAPRRMASLALAVALSCPPLLAWAADFRSVEPTEGSAAILYDSPSKKGVPQFIIRRYTPVEIVVNLEGWAKVRDAAGGLAWIERAALSDRRTLLVTAERAEVRQSPDGAAPLAFQAEKGVALELIEAAPAGWAKVKHRDGQSGYLKATQVWGL